MHSLVDITFNTCTIVESDLSYLGSMPNLRVLPLDYCNVTDEGMIAVAQVSKLNTLTLGGTHVTGQGLRSLGDLAELRILDGSGLEFSVGDLQHLPLTIDELYMPGCSVSDEIIAQLKRLPRLISLDVQGARITTDAVKALSQFDLVSLDLSDVERSPEALRELQASSSLQILGGWD